MSDATHRSDQKRILVVEDEQVLRDLYVQILRDAGYLVEQAEDGELALAALVRGGYDAVLLDIILPKLDGLKILEKLARETPPQKPNRVVIILSNLGQEDVIAKSISLGAQGYMIKSDFTPDQVVKQIKYYLDGE